MEFVSLKDIQQAAQDPKIKELVEYFVDGTPITQEDLNTLLKLGFVKEQEDVKGKSYHITDITRWLLKLN